MSVGRSGERTIQRVLQRWTLAAGFAVGQLGVLPTAPMHEPPAFVRVLPERRHGFAESELVGGRMVLTLDEPLDGAAQRLGMHCPN